MNGRETTQRVDGTVEGRADEAVVRASQQCRASIGASMPVWVAGIRNQEGDIYRLVLLDGLAQAEAFTRDMWAVGYAPAQHWQGRATAALDAVFEWVG